MTFLFTLYCQSLNKSYYQHVYVKKTPRSNIVFMHGRRPDFLRQLSSIYFLDLDFMDRSAPGCVSRH